MKKSWDGLSGRNLSVFSQLQSPPAAKLFHKAATSGNPVAQNRLAYLLLQGRGIEKDFAKAKQWRDRAVKAGLKDERLDKMLSDAVSAAKPQ